MVTGVFRDYIAKGNVIMCGITGYVGENDAKEFLLGGLEKLEYRGYDSAGICVADADELKVLKVKGRLKNLADKVCHNDMYGRCGIGHTRWATHGVPSETNSHPHLSEDGCFAVVHNGIIENYMELREFLVANGYHFKSETDTEVVPYLMQYYYDGDVLEALKKTAARLSGSYALGVVSTHCPGKLFAARKDSPLIVGIGDGENYIASDIPAVLNYTRKVYLLEQDEFAVVDKDNIKIYDAGGNQIIKGIFEVNWDVGAAEKDGYEFYMLKEIMEQPKAMRDTIAPRIRENKVVMDELSLSEDYFKNLNKIYIVACGSAYHVGLTGKYIFESLAGINTQVELASEFRYSNPVVCDNDLVIIISQSGETSDTLAALRYAKKHGGRILSVVNVKGSSIARESDDVLYTHAGPEIAVATTKAYSAQMQVMFLLGIYMAGVRERISVSEYEALVSELKALPDKTVNILKSSGDIEKHAQKLINAKDVFFIGRGIDYSVAMEGSLKLKEISYIHSEAYAAGELKHGTISLVEEGIPVIALATQEKLFDKMLSNIKEVKARGAYVIAVAMEGNCEIEKEADFVIYIPKTASVFAGALAVMPLQLIAYHISYGKGFDVDKPRNLAKSVTVE